MTKMKILTTMTALTSTASITRLTSITALISIARLTTLTTFITLTTLMLSASAQAQPTNKLIDRYTVLNPIQTPAQADPLSVVISIKFAKSVVTVKQAIEQLLRQSGYILDKNYEVEKINSFTLPKVHQALGPMSLKRMIKVLLGPAWDLSVDQTTRSIQIVQTGNNTLQVLTPDAKALLKGVITPSVLDEVVVISINNNLLLLALEKILPKGWRVVLSDDSQDLAIKTVSVVSEDSKRAVVIKKILTDVGAQGFFYKKLKLLVVRSHQRIIK
jgi:conjugative transfer region protein (TIGR03748 family)